MIDSNDTYIVPEVPGEYSLPPVSSHTEPEKLLAPDTTLPGDLLKELKKVRTAPKIAEVLRKPKGL